jgi:hypothetical protein
MMLKEKVVLIGKKYFSEFALIFISVILAFALTEWSSNQGEKVSETKILIEIRNGIDSDLKDFESNLKMHKLSSSGVRALRNWATGKAVNQDSLTLHYYVVYRNYSPIINKTGYESLRETSLKIISNDSLRFQIIKLYDYYYNILENIENRNEEMQDFKTYFSPMNKILTPYMVFDDAGELKTFEKANLSANQKNELLSYLWRMEKTKNFKIRRYSEIITEITELNKSITSELDTHQ